MVIRRVGGRELERRYRFVGISYVQGFMDGEALEEGGWRVRIWYIVEGCCLLVRFWFCIFGGILSW